MATKEIAMAWHPSYARRMRLSAAAVMMMVVAPPVAALSAAPIAGADQCPTGQSATYNGSCMPQMQPSPAAGLGPIPTMYQGIACTGINIPICVGLMQQAQNQANSPNPIPRSHLSHSP
jgi:hypothetical protein